MEGSVSETSAQGAFKPESRDDYGAFYTPQATADFMVETLRVGPTDRVLEPAAGEGAFVAALLRAGVRAEQITAWEYDPEVCEILRERFPGVTVEHRDTLLDTVIDTEQRYDRIVANPPYLNKASAYIRAFRDQLQRRYGSTVGAGETFTMFIYLCLRLLADDGRFVFIVGDTLRTIGTHERVRRLILDEYGLEMIAHTPKRLFPDASVQTGIFSVAQARRGALEKVRVLPAAADEAAFTDPSLWTDIPLRTFKLIDGAPFVLDAPESIVRLFEQPKRLPDWAAGHIGMHTRDNKRYLAAVEGSELAERYRKRAGKPGEFPIINAAQAASADWQAYLKEGGEKDFWAPQSEFVLWTPEAQAAYVRPAAEKALFGKPGFAVSGIAKRLSARVMPAGCVWDTNKVIGFVPHQPEQRDLLIGLLCSDLFTFIAKRLLNESSSIQVNDLRKLPIPDLPAEAAAGIRKAAAACIRAAEKSQPFAAERRQLNDHVYAALRISSNDRAHVTRVLSRLGIQTFS